MDRFFQSNMFSRSITLAKNSGAWNLDEVAKTRVKDQRDDIYVRAWRPWTLLSSTDHYLTLSRLLLFVT